jgi:hypothetical protein
MGGLIARRETFSYCPSNHGADVSKSGVLGFGFVSPAGILPFIDQEWI